MRVLASSDGHVVQFDPYQSAKKNGSTRSLASTWGLGELVVLDLLEKLPQSTSYHVYMDNFFTSFRLLSHLAKSNIQVTGVIRSNKLGRCPIEPSRKLDKKNRGFFDQQTESTNTVTVVGWNDNRSVYVASNSVGSQPTTPISRWCRKTAARISVEQPYLIRQYNRYMSGVDRCDQHISTYHISV
jgi:hypothetical protein